MCWAVVFEIRLEHHFAPEQDWPESPKYSQNPVRGSSPLPISERIMMKSDKITEQDIENMRRYRKDNFAVSLDPKRKEIGDWYPEERTIRITFNGHQDTLVAVKATT